MRKFSYQSKYKLLWQNGVEQTEPKTLQISISTRKKEFILDDTVRDEIERFILRLPKKVKVTRLEDESLEVFQTRVERALLSELGNRFPLVATTGLLFNPKVRQKVKLLVSKYI